MANKRRNGLSCSEAGKLGAIASKETQHKIKQSRIEKYLENPNLCKCCGCVLNYEKRGSLFCSKSCAARYNNLHRDKSVYEKQRTQPGCLEEYLYVFKDGEWKMPTEDDDYEDLVDEDGYVSLKDYLNPKII